MSELTEAELEEGIKCSWSDWPVEFKRKVIAAARRGLEREGLKCRELFPTEAAPMGDRETSIIIGKHSIERMAKGEAVTVNCRCNDDSVVAVNLIAADDIYVGPTGVPVAEPTVAGRKDEPSGNGLSPREAHNAVAMLELNNSRIARDYQDLVARLSEAQAEIERQAAEIAYWKEQATELGRTRQRNEAEIERQAAEIDGERAIASGWHKRWKEAHAEIERLREALQTILDIRVALSTTAGGK